jgi:hypothetical protein
MDVCFVGCDVVVFFGNKGPSRSSGGARRVLLSNPGGLAPRRAPLAGPGPTFVSAGLALLFSPGNKGPSPSTGPRSGSKRTLSLSINNLVS